MLSTTLVRPNLRPTRRVLKDKKREENVQQLDLSAPSNHIYKKQKKKPLKILKRKAPRSPEPFLSPAEPEGKLFCGFLILCPRGGQMFLTPRVSLRHKGMVSARIAATRSNDQGMGEQKDEISTWVAVP